MSTPTAKVAPEMTVLLTLDGEGLMTMKVIGEDIDMAHQMLICAVQEMNADPMWGGQEPPELSMRH
jgi:hypothetical protein